MGYVKLPKASGYDLLPAENIGALKFTTPDLIVSYVPSGTVTIAASSAFEQADVAKILDAVDKINGASGPSIAPAALSQKVTETTVS